MDNFKVSAIYVLQGKRSIIVPGNLPLENLISLVASENFYGTIFVINSIQQFIGLVSKTDLILWAHIKITGGKGRHEIPLWKFFKIADARIAADLVSLQLDIAVNEHDTL